MLPNFDEDFFLCIDANVEGIEEILIREGSVISYDYRKIKVS
jgi:hypothetical protein